MSEGGEPSAPATPVLLRLSYTTPRDAALPPKALIDEMQQLSQFPTIRAGAQAPTTSSPS
jgi:hypothetical protein